MQKFGFICEAMGKEYSIITDCVSDIFLAIDKWGCPDGYFMIHSKCVKVSNETAEAVEAEVLPYLSCAPGAVSSAKQLIQSLGPRIDDAVIDHTIRQLVARWETDEAQEGIGAFFDKRKPAWIS